MRQIDNYEQFCKAFVGDDNELKKEAKLLLFVQNWIIRILDYMEEDTLDYSLKKMVEQNADKMSNIHTLKDALSSIVDDSDLAFRHLNENMREKIVRENVQMPVYKVREINSYGLNWLSRQSGRTIRQKVSSAGNSIMAVQRRMSLDTAENRLFVAFAKELYEQLNTKLESLGEIDHRQIDEEEDMRDELAVFLRRDDIAEILSGADLFVLSSKYEGLPTVVIEAMACETFVVATDCGGSAEILGETGILVPIEDSEALAKGLEHAMKLTEDQIRENGKSARKRVETLFSLEASVNKWLALYEAE